MAIRVRKRLADDPEPARLVALCAAETEPAPGDLYLNDVVHHALYLKFDADRTKEMKGAA